MRLKLLCLLIFSILVGLWSILYTWHPHLESHVFEFSLLVTPVLFGLFMAFAIADRLGRIDKLRDNDSVERTAMIMLNNFSKRLDKNEYLKLNQLLDNYLMITLDYRIKDFHKTKPEFDDINDFVLNMEEAHKNSFFAETLAKMLSAREKTITIIDDQLTFIAWFTYCVLGALVVVPFTLVNKGTFWDIILTLGIALIIQLSLLWVYRLDTLKWKEEKRIFEPYQKTFEAIGLKRYFPESIIQTGRAKHSAIGEYRVGVFPNPYPDMSDKKIEINS